jgi:plasmid stability protein
MRNVTITLDEKVVKWARIEAARHDTSVSRLVGEMLAEKMQSEDTRSAALRRFLERPAYHLRRPSERLPRREELYDRI